MPVLTGERASSAGDCAGDVSEAQIVEIRNHRGQTLLSGELRSTVDALGNTEKDAALIDRAAARHWRGGDRDSGAGREDRQTELEVDILGLPARETFALFAIDDRIVATFTTDDRGSVDMELQEGEIPPRPPRA